jgi:hypothetical protein
LGKKYQLQNFEGGFYLERAIRTALFNAHKNKVVPIIIVVTDNIENAIVEKDFSDFKFAFPEYDCFYNLNASNELQIHSLVQNPMKHLPAGTAYTFENEVLALQLTDNSWAYLPDNTEPSIVLKKDVFAIDDSEIKEKNIHSAVLMQANWMSQTLHPETSDREWLKLIRYSFISKVMTPLTSYLVVENEAQKAILKKKQSQVLSGNKALDLDEETQQMSEPNSLILIVLLAFFWWFSKKKVTKQSS